MCLTPHAGVCAEPDAPGIFVGGNYAPHWGADVATSHVPALQYSDEGSATITIDHGQASDHYIGRIYVQDDQGRTIFHETIAKPSTPTSAPVTAVATVPSGTKALRVFDWCVQHGHWQGETYVLSDCACNAADVASHPQMCASACSTPPEVYTSSQLGDWSVGESAQHVPSVVQRGKFVVVTVPHGETAGAMHVIGTISVYDQNGTMILCLQRPNKAAGTVDSVTVEVEIPIGTTEVYATLWCSVHGHWRSSTLDIDVLESAVATFHDHYDATATVYTAGSPGPWTGKESSHVPVITMYSGNNLEVIVQVRKGAVGSSIGSTLDRCGLNAAIFHGSQCCFVHQR